VLSCILSGATGNLTQVSALFCCTAAHVAFISINVTKKRITCNVNLTFFVTTGTIRAQGSQYRLFTDKHFPTLIRILKQVLEINATCAAVQQNNAETQFSNVVI
jgi:hypothetical protein